MRSPIKHWKREHSTSSPCQFSPSYRSSKFSIQKMNIVGMDGGWANYPKRRTSFIKKNIFLKFAQNNGKDIPIFEKMFLFQTNIFGSNFSSRKMCIFGDLSFHFQFSFHFLPILLK